jgi:hypothetical protein
MTDPTPQRATNCVNQWDNKALEPADAYDVLDWSLALDHLTRSQLYWLTTVRTGGVAHVRPVFAVVSNGTLYSTTAATAHKTHLLEQRPQCTLATSTDGIDLVYEGIASRVSDRATLERVAAAYHAKYQWPVAVVGDAFTAPFGAPSAGPPPYHLYEIAPVDVFGFGTDDRYAKRSTRWNFA